MSTPVQLVLAVDDDELENLRSRLRATKWPPAWPEVSWEAGTDPDALHRLVDYWATGYNWRKHEASVNALPWYTSNLDGIEVHYLHFRAGDNDALPLVLTNGWPSSFLELIELARHLSDPAGYGGDASGAFHVVVPCLPGFAFTSQQPSLLDATPTHELWHRLMADELGYTRYAAHGGDLGAGTTSLLAQARPEAVVGIHLLAVADPVTVEPATLTAEEQVYLDEVAAWERDEGGYEHQQHTRPLTLAYGLSDSPAGLLAWILEKYRAWTDNDGDLSSRFSDDFVLTQVSLYWFTNTISTSFRPYWQYGRDNKPAVTYVSVPPRSRSSPPISLILRPAGSAAATTSPVTP